MKTNNKLIANADKYTISKYVNSSSKKKILEILEISQPTFWRKVNTKVTDPGGFEICQLKQIADILDRDLIDLVSLEAKVFYKFTPADLNQIL